MTQKPVKWKMAMLTWLCIYPLLNILFFFLMPLIGHLHVLLRTLVITLILVPIMGALIGFLQTKFWTWLTK